MADMQPLDFYEPRPAFQPSHAFGQQSGLPELLSMLRSSRHRTILNQEVRLSPVTLQILTDAHRVLGDDTHKLAVAVAELFRRCSTLQQELKDQIYKANEVKDKIDRISGNDKEGEGKGESDEARFERRIARAQDRQRELGERLERIRKHAGKVATRELSTKERALVEEVKSLEASLLGSTSRDAPTAKTQSQMSKRVQAVQQLRDELVGEVARIQKESEVAEGANDKEGKELSASQSGDVRIPSEVRKAKLRQVRGLLDRETALVEAVTARLTALQM
ncbi:Nucleoporin NUP82 like protein [Verticillium longisporum]|nr:Nucleoporin NUP82 like protein [Verticillium longisporum]